MANILSDQRLYTQKNGGTTLQVVLRRYYGERNRRVPDGMRSEESEFFRFHNVALLLAGRIIARGTERRTGRNVWFLLVVYTLNAANRPGPASAFLI